MLWLFVDLETVPFSLRSQLNEYLRVLAPAAHAKGLELNCDITLETPDCLASGMDDYITKPIRWAELASAIGRVVPPGATRAEPGLGGAADAARPSGTQAPL